MAEPFWAVLELMGHVRTAGRVTEEERFGAKLGRIDVPTDAEKFVTMFFSGSSIYRLTPCDEGTARAVALCSAPQPIHSYEMPRAALPELSRVKSDCGHTASDYDPEEDDDDDDDEQDRRY